MASNQIAQMWQTFRSVAQFDSFEFDGNARRLKRVASVDDLRRLAKRRLPAGVFDYIDGGAEDERTLSTNESDFARLEFKPRVLRDVSRLDTSTTIFGKPAAMPIVLSRPSPSPSTSVVSIPEKRPGASPANDLNSTTPAVEGPSGWGAPMSWDRC